MTLASDSASSDSTAVSNFWAALSEPARAEICRRGRTVRYRQGEVLISEGDCTDDVVVLMRGWVKVVTRDADGYESLLAARGAGDLVGEMAALAPIARTAEVQAITDLTVIRLPGSEFTRMLDANPEVSMVLLRVLVARLRHADQWRARCGSLTVSQRLAVLLLELLTQYEIAPRPSGERSLPFSQEELAGFVAASRKSVVRALGQLRSQGLVRTGRGTINVLRPAALHRTVAEHLPAPPEYRGV